MNNYNQWWKYYGLTNEPNLSIDPLSSNEDLELFYGRDNDIKKLETIISGNRRKTILLTGNPGVGKSTLINKVLHKEKGYIHVNLSSISKIEKAELTIAEATIETLKKISQRKSKRLRKRVEFETTKSRSKQYRGSSSTGCLGAVFGIVNQSTIKPIRDIEVNQIIKETFTIINNKHRLYLVLDESDFLTKIILMNLFSYHKE